MAELRPETIEFLKRRRRIGLAPQAIARDQRLSRSGGRQRMMGRARLFVKGVEPSPNTQAYARSLAADIAAAGQIEKRSPPLIIGLTGPSGVGKTEIVKHLLDKHGFVDHHVE